MRTVMKSIALGLATMFGLGVMAVSAGSHGDAVSDLAHSTTLMGAAKGDAISDLAMTQGKHKPTTNHGAVVSQVARSDRTMTVNGVTNHGFAVRLVARKPR